jgi:hypothetical protein
LTHFVKKAAAIRQNKSLDPSILQLSMTDIIKAVNCKNYYGASTADVFDGQVESP